MVGRRVDISLQDDWGERAPRTRIVAIGAAGGIDASLLEKTFASCIAADSRGHVITELGKPTLLAAKQWKFAHSSETGPPPRARHALKISPGFTDRKSNGHAGDAQGRPDDDDDHRRLRAGKVALGMLVEASFEDWTEEISIPKFKPV